MNISIYNIETGFIEELEIENSLNEILKVYKNIPDIPGCFLTLNKDILGLKLQVVNTILYRYIFYYKEEKKSILAHKAEGKKIIEIFVNDQLEFVRLFEHPERYIIIAQEKIIDNKKHEVILPVDNTYKVYKGKKFTEAEWVVFEQKQWEVYAKKHNIPISPKEEKPDKPYPPSPFFD